MCESSPTDNELIRRAIDGDQLSFATLFEKYRARLRRMIDLRIDGRLKGRVGTSDVLQDAFIDATGQLGNYAKSNQLPVFLWLRLIAGQRLAKAHRFHLGTAKRDVQREIKIPQGHVPEASTFNLASHLVGNFTTASNHLRREELRAKVHDVLNQMKPNDREVIALRHFEQMTIKESAMVLGISEKAAGNRYLRAIERIVDAFEDASGILSDPNNQP